VFLPFYAYSNQGEEIAPNKLPRKGVDYRIIDYKLSPYVGAENLYTLQRIAENTLLPKDDNIANRLVDLFICHCLAWSELVVQHEYFGHGYRCRDLNNIVFHTTYHYKFLGDAATEYYYDIQKMTPQILSSITLGGLDSNAIYAQRLKMHWLINQKVDPRQSMLYTYNALEHLQYSMIRQKSINFKLPLDQFVQEYKKNQSGNDIMTYLYSLHITYPNATPLTRNKMILFSSLSLCDPILWVSGYSMAKYVYNGNFTEVPMITIGNDLKYLASLRSGFSPFGPEIYLDNYFVWQKQYPIHGYIKYGEFAQNTYWGLGIEIPKAFVYKTYSLGFCLDYWKQPKIIYHTGSFDDPQIYTITFGYPEEELHQMINGMSMYLIGEKHIGSGNCSIVMHLGGKTEGLLPGESLKASLIARVGAALEF
jgi:hypothetical protein